ncbi:MAG: hypothetical protein LH645_02375 [Actinomycetia bacterium]|nr:hypothetical protein [Actinomycetes bacterium]
MSQHHDPVHPDSDHLTPEVLADLELGLLDDESRDHAELHLTHCATCAALRGDFAALTDTMADLPDEPMPDAVWQQLATALAAEPVVTPAGAATVVPIETARKRRWGRPGIGVVAGAAGVALVGAIIGGNVLGGTNNSAITSDSGGPTAAGDNAREVLVNPYAATQSGTKYDAAALDAQVTQLVTARKTFSPTAAPTADSTAPTASPTTSGEFASPEPTMNDDPGVAQLATDPAAAQACLEGYLGVPGVRPLAIDIGKWQGEPAAIIVLPAADPNAAEVWVIDPDCSGPEGWLFYYATVPMRAVP